MKNEWTIDQIREFVKKDYQSVSARMVKCLLAYFDDANQPKEAAGAKRMFEIFDIMNVADGINKTDNLAVCDFMVSADKVKAGGHIKMGVPENVIMDLVFNRRNIKPILLIVNLDEYDKLK